MAATRKLQGEIDRCFKKVSEGVEIFEDIWQKVYSATNSNQKEKYEADLKKEIKKLQRLRDQIKSWLQSPEIKDKSALTEHRKLIETQMERFKIVERETKTKAYSKEGLGAAQKMDPAQKEREEVVQWLNASINSLNLQVDQFECEIESLLAAKKKKLDREKTERVERLREFLERHRFHIHKLEMLLRMLDNMSIEVEEIKILEDDVAYYIESCQDPDFKENPYIYDEINFEEFIADSGRPSSADGALNESANHSDVNGSQNALSPVNTPNHTAPATPNDTPDERRPKTRAVSGDSGSKSSTAAIIKSPPMYNTPAKSPESKPAATPSSKNTSPSSNTTSQPVLSASNQQFTIEEVNGSSTHSSGVEPTTPKDVCSTSSSNSIEANQPSKIGSVESSRSSTGPSSISSASSPLPRPAAPSPGLLNSDEPANIPSGYSQSLYELKEAYIPPLLGVTPLAPVHLSSEQQLQRQLLESAFRNLPHPSDSERLRYYLYRTPWITPQYYPQTPLPGSDSLEFFQKLSTESLFFIFYYLEGTKAQYLAAKALKKQSWRFHTRCMMWFQRHDEPKTITEEYEQGTYIYFDFEKWGQRKKEGFTFEYRYLEDRDLN